jgi:hypothetical protein
MGFIIKAIKTVVKTVVAVVSKVIGGVFGFIVGGNKAKVKAKSANTLNKTLDPEAYRKIVLGRTAAPLDLRFWEVYGTGGKLFDEVIALATHRINSVKELYLEDALAVSSTGVVQTAFSSVLSRAYNLGDGSGALSVGSGSQWTSAATFDGCAHMVLKWNPDEKLLPNGIPSRYTQIIEGAFVYDPRRDSTVTGGSGTHRANDRTTWAYATLDANGQPIGRNNALQALWYLLGWTIPVKDASGAVIDNMLVCGRGIDPTDINMATFIAGANACEVAGYYTDVVLSTEDEHTANEDKITCDGLIGRLIDPGGLWSYYANIDDTASVAVTLTDADVIGNVSWNEYAGMSDQFTAVAGKFINPSPVSLYQPYPYPMVRDAVYEANLGIKKRRTQDFEQILDGVVAQRLSRLMLNAGQYQGEFQSTFNYRAMRAQAWSVVRYNSTRFGWSKLFRVWRHTFSTQTGVEMLLREIDASIWTAGTTANAVTAVAGTKYNYNQVIVATGVAAAPIVITGPGTNPTIVDGMVISWTAPAENVRRTEARWRLVGTTYWETAPSVPRGSGTSVTAFPLVSGGTYEVQVRHISTNEIEGTWVNTSVNFVAGTSGNINYAGINAASKTADVSSLTDTVGGTTPVRTNVLTNLGISSGFTGQATIATDATAKPKLDGIEAGATLGANLATNVINATATYIAAVTGKQWASESGADITGGHIASGFTNQAPIATDSGAKTKLDTVATGAGRKIVTIFKQSATQPTTPTGSAIPAGWSLTEAGTNSTLAYTLDAAITASNSNTTFTKSASGNNWAGGGFISTTNGDMIISIMPTSTAQDLLIGLKTASGVAANYNSYNFAIQLGSDAKLYFYVLGTQDGTTVNYAANDVITLSRSGTSIVVNKNGSLVKTFGTAVSAGATFYAGGSIYTTSGVISNFSAAINSGTSLLPLWKSYSEQNADTTLVGTWSTPVRATDPEIIAKTGKVASTGRVNDPTFYNTQNLIGAQSSTNLTPTYTVGGSNVTVSLPSHTRTIAGASGPLTLSYGSGSGVVAFSTYWAAYISDPNLAGNASPTIVFTTNPNDLFYSDLYQIASGITPSSGGTGGSTTSGGGKGSLTPPGGGSYP